MTIHEPPRGAGISRRKVLALLTPVPLSALGGCASAGHPGDSRMRPIQPPPTTGRATPRADPGSPQSEVSHAPVTDAVALTFHGAGSPKLADAVLTEAEKGGARLTVLAVGQWLAQYPDMAHRVLQGGHELGNHTEHHWNIDRMSPAAAYAEIERCAQRLEQLTGSRGRWFRQSQGQHASPTVRAAARRAGYTTLLSYDLDSRDNLNPGTFVIERTVLGRIRGGDVVSLHLGHQQTISALPVILDELSHRGLRAVTASELFPPAGATSTP